MYLNTNLYNGSLNKDFKFNLTNVTIGSTSYNVDNKGSWGFADNNIENEYRYNIVNPMMGPVSDDGITPADPNITSIDKIGVAPAKKGDVISIYFVVSGMGEKESDEPSLVPTQEPSISPTVKPKVTPSKANRDTDCESDSDTDASPNRKSKYNLDGKSKHSTDCDTVYNTDRRTKSNTDRKADGSADSNSDSSTG